MIQHLPRSALLATTTLLALAGVAAAHVEVTSTDTATGAIAISAENESATADVVSLTVRLPDNVIQAEFPRVAGWRASGVTVALSPPLQIDGTTATKRVSQVTWTGGRIPPGASADFPLRVRVRAGTQRAGLAFPAVQRYSDGTVVRWIGAPGTDTPAGVLDAPLPVVRVSAPEPPATTVEATTTPTTATASEDDGGASLGVILAIVGGAAVVIGGAIGVVIARRRR